MGHRRFDDFDSNEWRENRDREQRRRQRRDQRRRGHRDPDDDSGPARQGPPR